MQGIQCFIKRYHCRYKIVVFSLSILTSNDNEIQTICFNTCFPFVNIFTNDAIKTPIVFLSPSLKNIKIRKEFIKIISIIKQKLIVILFWSSFFWYTRYSIKGLRPYQKCNSTENLPILEESNQRFGNFLKLAIFKTTMWLLFIMESLKQC